MCQKFFLPVIISSQNDLTKTPFNANYVGSQDLFTSWHESSNGNGKEPLLMGKQAHKRERSWTRIKFPLLQVASGVCSADAWSLRSWLSDLDATPHLGLWVTERRCYALEIEDEPSQLSCVIPAAGLRSRCADVPADPFWFNANQL